MDYYNNIVIWEYFLAKILTTKYVSQHTTEIRQQQQQQQGQPQQSVITNITLQHDRDIPAQLLLVRIANRIMKSTFSSIFIVNILFVSPSPPSELKFRLEWSFFISRPKYQPDICSIHDKFLQCFEDDESNRHV